MSRPKATNEQVKAICNLLHSRGREATWRDVRQWLTKLRVVCVNRGERPPNEQRVCDDVLAGEANATAALHIYFGEPLDDSDKSEGIGLCGD